MNGDRKSVWSALDQTPERSASQIERFRIEDAGRRFRGEVLAPRSTFIPLKAQAQCVVMPLDGGSGAREQRGLNRLGQCEHECLIPMVHLREFLLEEPVLDRGERGFAADEALLVCRGREQRLSDHCEFRDGLVLEEIFRSQRHPGLASAGDDLDAENGVATECEKIVVDADVIEAQHLCPNVGEGLLHGSARDRVGGTGDGPHGLGFGQGPAVELAVVGERQCGQENERRGNHVIREPCLQMGAQLVGGGRRVRHEVRNEPRFPSAVGAGDDDRFADCSVLHQHEFDLAEFDAKAAKLHLLVGTPEVFDRAVRQPAAEIAGAVEASVWRCDKFLRRQFRCSVVAERDSRAADVDLTRDTDRHGLQQAIEKEYARIRDGTPDGNRRTFALPDRVTDRKRGRLRRAVAIDEPLRFSIFDHEADTRGVCRFASENENPQAAEHRRSFVGEPVEERGREKEDGHAMYREMSGERGRREQHVAWCDDKRAAIQQRAPDLECRGVEADVRCEGDDVIRLEWRVVVVHDEAGDAAMRDDRAFWNAGGTRGEEHVGRAIRLRIGSDGVCGDIGTWLRIEDQRAGRLHAFEPRGGLVVIQRHVRGAGLCNAEHLDDECQRTFGAEPDEIARSNSL